jgi:hypothetical protein
MDTQDNHQAFFTAATKAFRDQISAAEACISHERSCLICRGTKSRWTRWLVDFLFECHTVKNLAFDAQVAKVDADEYRLGLEDMSDAVEVPSLEWLDGLYELRDDREG